MVINTRLSVMYGLCSLLLLVLLMGCNVTADEKATQISSDAPDYMQALDWVASADAKKDARQAIKQKDYRLFVVASRGEAAPGIDAGIASKLKQQCGIRYIQGSTDVVKGEEHMAALSKAYDYAKTYNQMVAEHCSK